MSESGLDPRHRPLSLAAELEAAAALVRTRADAIESERRLPDEVVAALKSSGAFRLCVPRALGGLEADTASVVRTIEAVATADGSAGWCVMIGATSGIVSAYLPLAAARELHIDPDTVFGGVFAPYGKAVPADGGYRVSGRWPFASGCQHCTWLMGGSLILDAGKPRLLANGMPDSRMLLFPAGSVEIIDTWSVSGLRGTGSHDMAVQDAFVPAARSVSLMTDTPQHDGPLYKFPVFGMLALGIAGVALGVGRRAIDELVQLATHKTPTASRRRLADRAVVQLQVAQAEAGLRSARAFLFETIDQTWQMAARTGAIDVQQRALLRLAATHATSTAAQVVDVMYTAGGGTAIYATSQLQRCLRDVHVATQHMMVASPTYEVAGRVFLGLETDTTQL